MQVHPTDTASVMPGSNLPCSLLIKTIHQDVLTYSEIINIDQAVCSGFVKPECLSDILSLLKNASWADYHKRMIKSHAFIRVI
jgi:hypothetical protein